MRRADATTPGVATAEGRASTNARLIGGALVVLVFAALAASYAVVQPLGQPSDEGAHLAYARLLSDHWALPGGTVAEKQQPPLYYLIAAGALHAGVPDQAVRAIGVILGVAFVVITMAVAAHIVPGNEGVAVLAGAMVAALPGVQSVAGSISDDPLAWVVGASIVFIIVDTLKHPAPTLRRAVIIGVVVAAALLSKETVWPLIVVLVAVVGVQWRGQLRATHLAAMLGLPVVLAGWWFVRNLVSFHRLTPPLEPIEAKPTDHLLRSIEQLKTAAGGLARSLFGPETGPVGPLPRSSWAEALIVVLIVGGCALALVGLRDIVGRWNVLDEARRRTAIALSACGVAVAIAWFANSVLLDLQPRARYLLVVAPAAATLLAVAAVRQAARRPRVAVPVAVCTAAAVVAMNADALRVAAHG